MSKLFAYLSYRDVDAAITWLEALGFENTTRQQDDGGATVHAELRLGDAVVMVAPVDEPYETPKLIGRSMGHGLYLLVDDVAALHRAALQAGGSVPRIRHVIEDLIYGPLDPDAGFEVHDLTSLRACRFPSPTLADPGRCFRFARAATPVRL
jgi:uncharacterized glyoxalase superfamily protein PhnB